MVAHQTGTVKYILQRHHTGRKASAKNQGLSPLSELPLAAIRLNTVMDQSAVRLCGIQSTDYTLPRYNIW